MPRFAGIGKMERLQLYRMIETTECSTFVLRFADLWMAGLKDIPELPVYHLVLPLCQCYGWERV